MRFSQDEEPEFKQLCPHPITPYLCKMSPLDETGESKYVTLLNLLEWGWWSGQHPVVFRAYSRITPGRPWNYMCCWDQTHFKALPTALSLDPVIQC